MPNRLLSTRVLVTICGLTISVFGCNSVQPSEYGYWPEPAAAERALRVSLDQWLGNPSGSSKEGANGRVETWDTFRASRRLERYEVLGPSGGVDERIYTVRLTLADPPEVLDTQYVVRGIEPIWVFRRDDYDRISHWEHLMSDAEAQKQQEVATPNTAGEAGHPDVPQAPSPSSIYRGHNGRL